MRVERPRVKKQNGRLVLFRKTPMYYLVIACIVVIIIRRHVGQAAGGVRADHVRESL